MKVATVPVRRGAVTLDAVAGQPYVLYPISAPAPLLANWGEGTHLQDPGFNAGNLNAWNVSGSATIDTLENGQHVASLGTQPSALRQRITGLTPGRTYSASAWIEVEPGKSRKTNLSVDGVSNTITRSTAQNLVAADDKHDAYFQRVRTVFTAKGNSANLVIGAVAGNAKVRIDDVRVVETKLARGRPGGRLRERRPGLGPVREGRRRWRHRPADQLGSEASRRTRRPAGTASWSTTCSTATGR